MSRRTEPVPWYSVPFCLGVLAGLILADLLLLVGLFLL